MRKMANAYKILVGKHERMTPQDQAYMGGFVWLRIRTSGGLLQAR
jgi:hypothetical protein